MEWWGFKKILRYLTSMGDRTFGDDLIKVSLPCSCFTASTGSFITVSVATYCTIELAIWSGSQTLELFRDSCVDTEIRRLPGKQSANTWMKVSIRNVNFRVGLAQVSHCTLPLKIHPAHQSCGSRSVRMKPLPPSALAEWQEAMWEVWKPVATTLLFPGWPAGRARKQLVVVQRLRQARRRSRHCDQPYLTASAMFNRSEGGCILRRRL